MDWMSKLPSAATRKPLINLCIPGSHDSFSYSLDRHGCIANDFSEAGFLKLFGPCFKSIIYRWSVTQDLKIEDQLSAGVRYVDVRLSQPDDPKQPVCTVHGLYGVPLLEFLLEIKTFVDLHRREVLLLDLNHFYNICPAGHGSVLELIEKIFGSALCPSPPDFDATHLTLEACWTQGYNVVVFYQCENSVTLPKFVWSKRYMQSPWPKTNNLNGMLAFCQKTISTRHTECFEPCFYNCQAILTPKTQDILRFGTSSLKKCLAQRATEAICRFLDLNKQELVPNLNIVSVDFVQTADFCKFIISCNY